MQLPMVESIVRSSGTATILPATSVRLLLHHGGRDGRGRASHPHARTWVDNRNCIAGAQGGRLVELHRVMVAVCLETGRRVVGIVRSRRKREAWCDLLTWLNLMLEWRRVGRAA